MHGTHTGTFFTDAASDYHWHYDSKQDKVVIEKVSTHVLYMMMAYAESDMFMILYIID